MEERAAHDAQAHDAQLPTPPSERGAWFAAVALATVGAAALALIASGVVGRTSSASGPPPVLAVTPTPAPALDVSYGAGAGGAGAGSHARLSAAVLQRRLTGRHRGRSIVGDPSSLQQQRDRALFGGDSGGHRGDLESHISPRWMQGFYPIYAEAQRVFGVDWLLIASIHKQETAFSTNPTTYHGLNFAGCCGGPMQFNVTNGPVTTWALVSNSYAYGHRPSSYDHRTATHPSIYDDFDSIMAAAHLLSADGAGYALDASAWGAAYDYYGHDLTGVTYADEVLARAIGWSQHGFCVDCGVSTRLMEAVHAAYGAPVQASLEPPPVAPTPKRSKRAGKH